MVKFLAAAAAISICAYAGDSQPSAVDLLERKLLDRIRAIEEGAGGVVGVAAIDLDEGRTIAWNGNTVFPQASSIKIPILIETFQAARDGRLKLDDAITLEQADTVGGSGHLQILLRTRPVSLTVRELAAAMIETSDNTATNKLIAMLGMERVNASLGRLGFKQTRLQRIMLDTAAAARGEENVSTPTEMARLMELIYRRKAVDADASNEMLEIMKRVNADFRAVFPAAIAVASKPGEVTGVRCETGVVFLPGRPFVLSVMSTFLSDGENPVPAVARAVYDHFAKLAASNRYGNRLR
jgi:beta-lactamase class A